MKYIFSALVFSLISQTALAQDMMQGLMPPKMQKATLNYTGVFHDSATFGNANLNTSYQSMDLSVPVYKTDDESYTVSLSGSQLALRPEQSNYSELYDMKMGFGYTKALEGEKMWSASIRYGSASDKPFADANVTTIGATWFYSKPSDATSRWLYLVDYSNNRPILNNIPIPGFAYFYYPSKDFRATFGAPFASINWTFTENWTMDLFTLVPWIFKGSVGYKFTEYGKIYAGVDFSQATYYLAGRQNNKDRLFYDEKKLFVGIKSPLSKNMSAELEMGHAFDRAFFVAEEYAIDPDNVLTVGNAYYAKTVLRFMY